ncbi:MAG: hypothetical protein U0802_04435 [Candidatus Binatia bacterium]
MSRRRPALRVCAPLLLMALLSPAQAQPPPSGLGSDLRLEGIVEPAAGADTLGTIRIRAGAVVRRFGVVRAQTARVEGMSLFNRSELHPEQLLLMGTKDQLATFQGAAPGSTLRMLGRYQGDDYLLAEITAGSATPGATR